MLKVNHSFFVVKRVDKFVSNNAYTSLQWAIVELEELASSFFGIHTFF
jgi:hypothetical protein